MKKKDFLVFGKPYLTDAEIDEVADTIRSGWIGTGPKTEQFEHQFASFAGARYALGVSSATAGLHLSLVSLGIGNGDEVITTPLTFCSTVNVIEHTGARPVFVDVTRDDWNIDASRIEKAITSRTKAIIPVHLHGRPCNMAPILALAKKHGLYVIEDAAHAVEAWNHGKKIGSISDVTVFSFYATKNMTTGEGGMVTSRNRKLIEHMRILSLHGLSRDAYKRYSVRKYRNYECLVPGYKYNLTDLASSLGIHQLSRLRENSRTRARYWNMYTKHLNKIHNIGLPAPEEKGTVHARHLYGILLPVERLSISRDEFIDKLIKRGIGSGVHFTPVHLHQYYSNKYGYTVGDFPNAEYVGEREVSLPLSAGMSARDVERTIEHVSALVKKYYC